MIFWLSSKSIEDKIKFTEMLLFDITVMNRSLWSDPNISDKFKIEPLKCSNELTHRIWGLLFGLKKKSNNKFENDLVEYVNIYGKQSEELKRNMPSTIIATIERFNYLEKEESDERE